MGRYKSKLQSIQEANKRILNEQYDEFEEARKQAWALVGKDDEVEEVMSEEGFVIKFQDLMQLFNDIQNNVEVLDNRTQKEIEMDMKSLDHKLKVLWEKVKYINLPKD